MLKWRWLNTRALATAILLATRWQQNKHSRPTEGKHEHSNYLHRTRRSKVAARVYREFKAYHGPLLEH
jgi:hypothetical protein